MVWYFLVECSKDWDFLSFLGRMMLMDCHERRNFPAGTGESTAWVVNLVHTGLENLGSILLVVVSQSGECLVLMALMVSVLVPEMAVLLQVLGGPMVGGL